MPCCQRADHRESFDGGRCFECPWRVFSPLPLIRFVDKKKALEIFGTTTINRVQGGRRREE